MTMYWFRNRARTHIDESDLVLYFYGEAKRPNRIAQHLDTCPECAASYADLGGTLRLIAAPPAPDRDDLYGLEVWQRIRPRLPAGGPFPRSSLWQGPRRAAIAGVAVLVVGAVLVGIPAPWHRPDAPTRINVVDQVNDASARARIAAITDHLEEAERMLLDFVNGDERGLDLTDRQASASDLLESNRLYRDAASHAGDEVTAGLLEDLERSLLEIAHPSSRVEPSQLDQMRVRLESAHLLLNLRMMADQFRKRGTAPPPRPKTT